MQMQSYSHFFIKNISVYGVFNAQSFNDTLTNVIVSFEQLDPGCKVSFFLSHFECQFFCLFFSY